MVRVLVTSRAPLHLSGERQVPVAPLAVPDVTKLPGTERLAEYAAVTLFVERACEMMPDFALTPETAPAVAAICARLDGLPLAIELAAARVKVLPPVALLARLERRLPLLTGGPRDLPARLQTMRDAIAWSYELLNPAEQRLFRCLAVFVGGWTLMAAQSVCSAVGESELPLLDQLASLIDKSLVTQGGMTDGEPRFAMLETIREFAAEQLATTPEADLVHQRHAEFYLELAEALEPLLDSAERDRPLAQLTMENDNLRAALAFGETASTIDGGELWLRLAGALGEFWNQRGRLSEGRDWLTRALAAGAGGPPALRAQALHAAAELAWFQNDYAAARALQEDALAMLRQLGDLPQVARSLANIGTSLALLGDPAPARARAEEAVLIGRRIGNPRALTMALNGLAMVTRMQGDLPAARAASEESLPLARATGDPQPIAMALRQLGRIVRDQGDLHAGRMLLEESLPFWTATANPWQIGITLHELGSVAVWEGEYGQAVARYSESLRVFEEAGLPTSGVLRTLAYVARLQGDFPLAVAHEREAIAQCRGESDTDKRMRAACLSDLAGIAYVRGEPRRAARLFGASEALCEPARLPYALLPLMRRVREDDVAAVRAALGDEAFTAEWAAGQALPVELAIFEALSRGAQEGAFGGQAGGTSARSSATTEHVPFPDRLTEREVEVLSLLATGMSNREIAAALVVSVRTVGRHVDNIYGKIGVHERGKARQYAREHGLVSQAVIASS
jgi:predicted ATPase/DNA-binding CsgD family transcriptional regulator